MAGRALIDTGALIAFLDDRDPWHARCRTALAEAPLPLITTSGVLTELFCFALRRGWRVEVIWAFLRGGKFALASLQDSDLPQIAILMTRYADRPMDFADATLVHVAEREGLKTILTVDHADFATYRIGRNAKFRILPTR
jgi:hypothetical protein